MATSAKLRVLAVVCVLLAGMTAAAPGKIIYVDDDATGANNGSSWVNAYRYLQDALASATGTSVPVEIHVAQGTYKPDRSSAHPEGTRDRFASFTLLNNVAVMAGFAGVAASDPDARDISLYETILSGDLAGDDVPVADACDLPTEPARGENSVAVVSAPSVSRSAILDGFTITGGNGRGRPRGNLGAGLYLCSPSGPCGPSVKNCTFVGNLAGFGGAVVAGPCTYPEIMSCAFVENAATDEGGALGVSTSSSPSAADSLIIRGCTFTGNYAQRVGGAIHVSGVSFPTVESCLFVGNSAGTGGAIHVDIHGTADVTNCRFICNSAAEAGGAVYFIWSNGLNMTSCTLFANRAPNGCAIACLTAPYAKVEPPSAVIKNTILWDGGDEIGVREHVQMDITYSDIQGGWPGRGNIDADPLFAGSGYWDANGTPKEPNDDFWVDGDYHLKSQAGRWDPNTQGWVEDEATSPCVDAGDPNSPVGDEPEPNGGRVNLGAYGGTAEASKS